MPPNKLNDLDSKTWLKFQKSWFIHNPPPRKKGVLVNPAKFPETMAQEFIEFFTKKGGTVLDPMAGTGSTLIAALRAGRNSYGIELNPKYAEIARQIVAIAQKSGVPVKESEADSLLLALAGVKLRREIPDTGSLGICIHLLSGTSLSP